MVASHKQQHLHTTMAPSKLNPSSQPLAPSTATLDAPGGSFSPGKKSTGLREQNKPAAGSSSTKSVSSRSTSPNAGAAAMNPANMSPTSGGWFGGWGMSRPAAARRTTHTHTRSKSWFGGGKSNPVGERRGSSATTGAGAKSDLGDSAKASTTTPSSPALGSSPADTAPGSVSGGDNDTSGGLGINTGEPGSDAKNTESSTTDNSTLIETANVPTPDQADQVKEETVPVQQKPATSKALRRELSLDEPRVSDQKPSRRKQLEAENTSLKEQLEKNAEAQATSQRERDQARDECRNFEETVEQLEKEVSSLHATNHELRVDATSLREGREALEKEVSSMYTTIDELKADNASLKDSREALEQEVSSTYTAMNKLKDDNTALTDSKEALEKQVATMHTTIDELNADYAALKKTNDLEISSLRTIIDELKTEITSLTESNDELEDALATEKEESQQTLSETRLSLQNQLDAATAQIASLQTSSATLQETLESTQTSLSSTQTALEAEKLHTHETEIRLEERRELETKLETYLSNTQATALQHAHDLEKLREDNTRLQALLTKKKHNKIFKNESQKLSEQNAELVKQLQQSRAQAKQLATDLAAEREREADKENSKEGKSKFNLKDIIRRPTKGGGGEKGEGGARPLTSHGGVKREPSRPLTSKADRRSFFM